MKPNKRATIQTLLERGTPQREIARLTGIDRKTVRSYQERWLAEQANSPGVATGSEEVAAPGSAQTPPPWPPAGVPVATSLCEPHREFIEAQVRLGRNAVAIYQDLVDQHGFRGAYNSVKRFVARLRHKEPERFDRLSKPLQKREWTAVGPRCIRCRNGARRAGGRRQAAGLPTRPARRGPTLITERASPAPRSPRTESAGPLR